MVFCLFIFSIHFPYTETFVNNILAADITFECVECAEEILNLKRQIRAYENKCKEEKELYQQALITNLKHDITIDELEEKLKKTEYKQFDDRITVGTVTKMCAFSGTKEDDCKFVTSIIHDLYRENIEVLKERTCCGRSNGKKAISPEKRKIIEEAFANRIKSVDGAAATNDRMKNLNKLIKSSIEKINIKNASSQCAVVSTPSQC